MNFQTNGTLSTKTQCMLVQSPILNESNGARKNNISPIHIINLIEYLYQLLVLRNSFMAKYIQIQMTIIQISGGKKNLSQGHLRNHGQ
jgi:hypothetical protein